ncbi:MAG: DUF5668 domain-containing protein [Bacillota bacterium]
MRSGTLLLALFLILAGVIIFITNLGYVSPEFSWQLFRLWPLILIIIGLSLFWGGIIPRPVAFSLVLVLVAGIVALALFFPGPGPGAGVRSDLRITQERYPDLEEGFLSLRFGGGRLFLNIQTEHWFDGVFHGSTAAIPSYSTQGEKLTVRIRQGRNITVWPWQGRVNNWHINLSPDLLWDLELDSGAVDGELDLEGLPLNTVRIKLGAGNMTVRLGNNGEAVKMNVEAGAANLKIQVPEDTGLSIGMTGVLANSNLRELGWPQVEGRYRSPAYEKLSDRVNLDIEVAVGNFTVEVLPIQR